MAGNNFVLFFMAGILITTAWATSVILSDLNQGFDGPQPDIEVRTAYREDSGITMTMTNHGEPANFSKFKIQYRIDGETYNYNSLKQEKPGKATNNTCFTGSIDWKTDVTYSCKTGVKFPGATERITLIINYADGELKWRERCQPATNSAVGC